LLAGYHSWGDGQALAGENPNEDRWTVNTTTGQFPRSGRQQYDFISEGDTPSYMQLFDFLGLRSRENPEWGGWGGRFIPNSYGWIDTGLQEWNTFTDRNDVNFGLTRWVEDIQADFAARADWGVATNFADANHPPTVEAVGSVDLNRRVGTSAALKVRASDPDGDALTYRWWQYGDADTYQGDVTITGDTTANASLTVPADARAGDTIHVIAEVKDSGSPAVKRYQRFIITVVGAYTPSAAVPAATQTGTSGAQPITITGEDLFDVRAVLFDGVPGTNIQVSEDGTSLSVTPPVFQAGGSVRVEVLTQTGSLAAGHVQAVEPRIAEIAPATGAVAGGTVVTLQGAWLAGATDVRFGSVAGTIKSVSDDGTTLVIVAPPGGAGTVDITVVLPGPDAVWTDGFTYVTAAPTPPSTTPPVTTPPVTIPPATTPPAATSKPGAPVTVPGPTVTVTTGAPGGAHPTPTITVTARSSVVVPSGVLKVKAGQNKVRLAAGTSIKIPAFAFTGGGGKAKVAFKSSKKKVAKVSKVGKIKAVKPGKATITITAGGKKAVIKVTVVAKASAAKVSKVNIKGVPASLKVGAVAYAKATWKKATATKVKVKYSSSNPAVASVDKVGRIVAKAPGTAVLSVKAKAKTKKVTITVTG
jgi:hypothetical protein